MPFGLFTYHVVNLDPCTQILLVRTGMGVGTLLVMRAYECVVGGGSRALGNAVRFEVTAFDDHPPHRSRRRKHASAGCLSVDDH